MGWVGVKERGGPSHSGAERLKHSRELDYVYSLGVCSAAGPDNGSPLGDTLAPASRGKTARSRHSCTVPALAKRKGGGTAGEGGTQQGRCVHRLHAISQSQKRTIYEHDRHAVVAIWETGLLIDEECYNSGSIPDLLQTKIENLASPTFFFFFFYFFFFCQNRTGLRLLRRAAS